MLPVVELTDVGVVLIIHVFIVPLGSSFNADDG
jgi:hypothetical protein